MSKDVILSLIQTISNISVACYLIYCLKKIRELEKECHELRKAYIEVKCATLSHKEAILMLDSRTKNDIKVHTLN